MQTNISTKQIVGFLLSLFPLPQGWDTVKWTGIIGRRGGTRPCERGWSQRDADGPVVGWVLPWFGFGVFPKSHGLEVGASWCVEMEDTWGSETSRRSPGSWMDAGGHPFCLSFLLSCHVICSAKPCMMLSNTTVPKMLDSPITDRVFHACEPN